MLNDPVLAGGGRYVALCSTAHLSMQLHKFASSHLTNEACTQCSNEQHTFLAITCDEQQLNHVAPFGLTAAGQQLTAAGPISQRQATRLLQHYSTQLLAQVPFDTLQAQVRRLGKHSHATVCLSASPRVSVQCLVTTRLIAVKACCTYGDQAEHVCGCLQPYCF